MRARRSIAKQYVWLIMVLLLSTKLTNGFFKEVTGTKKIVSRSEILRCKIFADPNWNWGYAQGLAHDAAMQLRGILLASEERTKFISDLVNEPDFMDMDVIHLALGLSFQCANRERLKGSMEANMVMESLVACKYVENDIALMMDLDELISCLPAALVAQAGTEPGRGGILAFKCAQALCGCRFIERGL